MRNTAGFDVAIYRNIDRWGFEIYIIKHHPDGKMTYAKEVEFETVDVERGVKLERDLQFLHLPEDLMQMLFDAMWRQGFRPIEVGVEGAIKATENHLADMQKLSWRLLDMVEKEGTCQNQIP